MDTTTKIAILADAAKYDASCSTSGSARDNSPGGIGNGAVGGICHAWAADGRCVALLKVLLSNACAYDCAYCVNRRSNDVARAAFEPEELIRLIVDFYRRNYIEGAFLSSGVMGCPDGTMERLVHIAQTLRERERFNGYIHIKIIPGTSERLVLEAARWADRASVNIELPSAASLARFAPDKKPEAIFGPMRTMARAAGFEPKALPGGSRNARSEGASLLSDPTNARRRETTPARPALTQPVDRTMENPSPRETAAPQRASVMDARTRRTRDPHAATIPAGQTTQLVIGASPESDATILSLAENLYLAFDVRRVYYSAFIPTSTDSRLPAPPGPPLAREHRLYQADWLFRFYGFRAEEILDPAHPFLDPRIDPKSDWALRNLWMFPVEITKAEYRELLRVPGIGPTSAKRIVAARRHGSIRVEGLSALGVAMRRAKWFITVAGKFAADHSTTSSERAAARRGTLAAASALDHPETLRRALLDPAYRDAPNGQFEFAWETD